MNELYPLKFKPVYKEKVWGGNKISSVLQHNYSPLPNCGEVWMVSGVEDNESVVTNGFLKSNTLSELVEVYMGDLVGDKVFEKFGNEFPLLFKFIDTQEYLSVQVHPDDELAMERHDSLGKTEMWYVLQADQGAQLISGFKKKMHKSDYLMHLKNKTLKEILNFEPVSGGDVFYIPAGHVHAIGPGILLAEIQQSSDVTYRIYDWDRFDAAGITRELHTDLALDAINFDIEGAYKARPAGAKNRPVLLQESEFFTVNMIDADISLNRECFQIDSFIVHLCIEGSYELTSFTGNVKVSNGQAVLIPASTDEYQIIPSPSCKILETYIQIN
ncbi:MAG: type I phosphomannose isomerase catalytic subunit [Bacteroidota bacterium]